jgi:hypothetical protein
MAEPPAKKRKRSESGAGTTNAKQALAELWPQSWRTSPTASSQTRATGERRVFCTITVFNRVDRKLRSHNSKDFSCS